MFQNKFLELDYATVEAGSSNDVLQGRAGSLNLWRNSIE